MYSQQFLIFIAHLRLCVAVIFWQEQIHVFYHRNIKTHVFFYFCDSTHDTSRKLNIDKHSSLLSKHSSWGRLSYSSAEDVFKTSSRRLDQDEYIRLGDTSSKDVFMTSSRCLIGTNIFALVIQLQAIFQTFSITFKTFLRRLAKTSSRRFQDLLKTSCKNVFNASSICLQYIFIKCCKDVFKAFS